MTKNGIAKSRREHFPFLKNTSTWQHDGVKQQSSVRDKYVEHKQTRKVKGKYRGFGWLQTELTITIKARFELKMLRRA